MSVQIIAGVGADCVACGNCSKHCPFEAIAVNKGLCAEVNESKCKGCGKCRDACPADVISYERREERSA